MSSLIFRLYTWINHCLQARTKYYMHSPFVYDLMAHVLKNNGNDTILLEDIRVYRNKIGSDKSETIDFAAIGAVQQRSLKTITEIEKQLSIPHRYGKRLFRCVQRYKYKNILEIGTCIGIGTLYLAKANPDAHIWTLEGNAGCVSKARTLFAAYNINNVTIIEGLFDDTLQPTLLEIKKVDMVVLDGNHQYESTIRYIEWILPFLHEDSMVVIDDIHWSEGMQRAWDHIILRKEVMLSLDFYRNGYLFFKKNRLEKENMKMWVCD